MAPSPATVSCDLTGEQRESLTQNVMLTRGPNGDRVAMLGDFGLSKRLEDTLDMAKTCIGTPFYMVRAPGAAVAVGAAEGTAVQSDAQTSTPGPPPGGVCVWAGLLHGGGGGSGAVASVCHCQIAPSHVSPHRRLRCCGHPTRLAVGVSGSRTAPNRRSQRTVQRSTIGIELEGHQLVASGVV